MAHGIPGGRLLRAGDLINIDISAEKDGYFADTGASMTLGGSAAPQVGLCRDGQPRSARGQPRLADVSEGRAIIEGLAGLSATLGTLVT